MHGLGRSGGGGMLGIIFYAERSDALGWNIVKSLLCAVFVFCFFRL